MLLSHRPLSTLLLLALLGGASAAALAAPQQGNRKPPRTGAQDSQDGRANNHRRNDDTLSDSIRKVERATRGQVLSAERVPRVPYDGSSVNRIKIVDSRGRVRIYTDDPGLESGAVQKSGKSQSGSRPSPPTHGDDD